MLFVTYPSVQRPCNLSEIVPDILRTVTPGDVFVETVFFGVGKVVYGSYRICPVIIIYVIVPGISLH